MGSGRILILVQLYESEWAANERLVLQLKVLIASLIGHGHKYYSTPQFSSLIVNHLNIYWLPIVKEKH